MIAYRRCYNTAKERCAFLPLDLIPMLLQNDPYQLTARADSRLGKKLLRAENKCSAPVWDVVLGTILAH